MARKYLVPIDLSKLELQNAAIQNLSTTQINAISSPATGQIVYDTTAKSLKVYDGTAWQPAGTAISGSGAPSSTPSSVGAIYVDTTNDVLYIATGTASSADWSTALPAGATGDIANLGGAASSGSSVKYARADHVHRHAGTDHAAIKLSDLGGTNAADIPLGGFKITGLADPTSAQDAATKAYVDNAVVGIDWKASVRAISTTNITLSGTQTVDGVTLAVGDRILVAGQTTASANGIYVVASGAWSRSSDADTNAEVTTGFAVFVEEGTAYADTGWVLQTNGTITVGTTALTFIQFTGLGQVTAGAGLTKSGNTLDVGTASSGRIVVNADNIDLATVSQTNTSGTAGVNFIQSHTVDSYGRVTGTVTADVRDATTSVKGIASFSSSEFTVSSGAVSVNSIAGSKISGNIPGNAANVTGTVAVANGGTGATTAAGARSNLGATTKVTGTTTAGTTTSVNHGLGQWVHVQVFDSATGAQVECDITNASTSGGTTTIGFAVSQAAGAFTYVIVG